jgi:hypothetical protein
MPAFRRERPAPRNKMLSIRITDEEDRLLEDLRQRLGLDAKVDVFRQALDYFLENAPHAQKRKGKD